MTPLPITAFTLSNGCGVGVGAVRAALRAGTSGLAHNDFELAPGLDTWIGRVEGLESMSLPSSFSAYDCRNNRLAQLSLEQDGFVAAVAAARQRHRSNRIAVFLGTTTSGILSTEWAMRNRASMPAAAATALSAEHYRYRHNMHATTEFVRAYLGLAGHAMTISTACSSSAKVFGAAARAIDVGLCDAAVVGGVDSLALSTLFGFRSLELLSREPCRPFAADRDGISIGEGAGFALLDPAGEGIVELIGCGESSDAFHMSTPHPEGVGAASAMRSALASASLTADAIDYINLHGTASRANDVAEDRAVTQVFGSETAASSTKAWTGHLLGAAGITEALISAMTLVDQWIPKTLNCVRVDPALRSNIQLESRAKAMRAVMTNSFGFGGSNCSLILGVNP